MMTGFSFLVNCPFKSHSCRGVMHSLFLRATSVCECVCVWGGGGGGRHVTHSSHNSTYVLFIFDFLFETFPNALTISQNILILTFS